MAYQLNAEKALLFRITHIKNLHWVFRNGLYCKNAETHDSSFVRIGNPELISKRSSRDVPIGPGGTLSDYIPFYFTPFSMMMYNINTGYNGIQQVPNSDIAIVAAKLRDLADASLSFVFTDRHAYLRTAQFYSSLDDLDKIDWKILQQRDFKRSVDDPEKTDRYQAEALIYQHLPVELLTGIVCYGVEQQRLLQQWQSEAEINLKIVPQPKWYFQ